MHDCSFFTNIKSQPLVPRVQSLKLDTKRSLRIDSVSYDVFKFTVGGRVEKQRSNNGILYYILIKTLPNSLSLSILISKSYHEEDTIIMDNIY